MKMCIRDSEIPCFLDNKRSVLKNPFVEFIRAALEIVEQDFSYEAVFRYLRSGLSGMEMCIRDRNICVNTAMTEEITPEILIMNLASYGMLPDTVTVKSFSEGTETAKDGTVTDKRLTLNLSCLLYTSRCV